MATSDDDFFRGVCPECGRSRVTRRDGRLPSHRSKSVKCAGSGRTPVGGRVAPETGGAATRALRGGLPGQGARA